MEARLDYAAIAPEFMKAMHGLERYVQNSSIEAPLREIVKLRASQINGCAYCVDMHWKDARAGGESEERLYSLVIWRESPLYTERERAALLWTETVTLLSETHVPDEVYEEVRQHFTDKELVDLTATIALINAWNRFGVTFRDVPGVYQPRSQKAAATA